jgi:hypothetical protein
MNETSNKLQTLLREEMRMEMVEVKDLVTTHTSQTDHGAMTF